MDINTNDFVTFEQQFVELISEFQLISTSENQLREQLRNEAARAEAAEAAKDAAERGVADARANAAAAATCSAQVTKTLATTNDELVTVKIQLEFSDRQRVIFEEKCAELSNKLNTSDKEVQLLRPLQSAHSTLQRQYVELQERIRNATEEARNETSRLENELRRVEKCANAGMELRERARLAAAAHARERRFAAAELRQTAHELKSAKAEIARQAIEIAGLQGNLFKKKEERDDKLYNQDETLTELRATLEAEKAGAARLERALASAIADNRALVAQLHAKDTAAEEKNQSQSSLEYKLNIAPIDLFLAE